MHGNEFAGAIVLDRLLRRGLKPSRGRISFAFVNLAAHARFDPRAPTLSRFIDDIPPAELRRIVDTLRKTGHLDDTLLMFLQDNGMSREEFMWFMQTAPAGFQVMGNDCSAIVERLSINQRCAPPW